MLGIETFETEVEVDDDDGKRDGKATIKWSVEFECRSWGIKSIILSVPDQEFRGWLEKRDDCTEENFESQKEDVSFMIKDVCVIDAVEMGEIVCPQVLHISKGKFTVEF